MKQISIHLVVIALICGCSTPKPRFEELIFRGDTRRMFEIATSDGHPYRIQAIYHLGDLPGRDVVEVLLKLLIDGDESARHWAADSIGRIGTQVILPEETVAALIELLELPDYELRAEIGLCLARVGSTAAVLSLARLLNPGGDYEFQRALVHGLQEAFYVPPDGGQMPDNVGLLVVNALLTYSASCYQGDLRQLAESLANGILRRRGRTWDVPGDRSAGNRPNILEHAVSGSSYAAPGPPFDH